MGIKQRELIEDERCDSRDASQWAWASSDQYEATVARKQAMKSTKLWVHAHQLRNKTLNSEVQQQH